MDGVRDWLPAHQDVVCCPACGGDLAVDAGEVSCAGCSKRFPVEDGIPLLFLPNDWEESRRDVTAEMRAFYRTIRFACDG